MSSQDFLRLMFIHAQIWDNGTIENRSENGPCGHDEHHDIVDDRKRGRLLQVELKVRYAALTPWTPLDIGIIIQGTSRTQELGHNKSSVRRRRFITDLTHARSPSGIIHNISNQAIRPPRKRVGILRKCGTIVHDRGVGSQGHLNTHVDDDGLNGLFHPLQRRHSESELVSPLATDKWRSVFGTSVGEAWGIINTRGGNDNLRNAGFTGSNAVIGRSEGGGIVRHGF
ncbi:hypothetical protein BJ165DRAFT_1598410 [Panaeolus papilionaceus]|nr:hypothetical protein BJ165DRAFT_1598410 [Panaeolus papilionaceus]